MLSNCGAGEDSWESLGLQGDQTNPKGNQPWIFIRRTDAEPSILCHMTWWADSLEKTLMLGQIEGKRRGWLRVRQLDRITDTMDMNLSKLWEIVKDREAWHAAVHGVTKIWTWLSKWTTTTSPLAHFSSMGYSGTLFFSYPPVSHLMPDSWFLSWAELCPLPLSLIHTLKS